MPRSRTTSPIPGPSFVPGLTLTHSNNSKDATQNYYNRTASSSSSSAAASTGKKHKYVKPRIGSSFQAKVEPFSESIAKAAIRGRQLERTRGISSIHNGGGSSHVDVNSNDQDESNGGGKAVGNGGVVGNSTNDIMVAGEEYGSNGGIFAAPSSSSNGHGYGLNNTSYKRRKPGRPSKNAKANRGKGMNRLGSIRFGLHRNRSSVFDCFRLLLVVVVHCRSSRRRRCCWYLTRVHAKTPLFQKKIKNHSFFLPTETYS